MTVMSYKILCCGSNGYGQLGIGNHEDQDSLQEVIYSEEEPICMAFGGNHTIISTKSGIYGSGSNSTGQLGLSSIESVNHFTKIDSKSSSCNWRLASCGWEFSVLVNDENEIYVSGLGLKGELGLGNKMTKVDCFTKIDFRFPDTIVLIKSSLNHTIVKLQNGQFYGWGVSRKGQLGSTNEKVIWEPTILQFEPCIKNSEFTVGRDFTVLYNEAEIHILGNNERIRNGLNERKFSKDKQFNENISSMWSSIHIEANGVLDSIGNNSHGQFFPNTEGQFSKFAIGSEHGLAVSTQAASDCVFAWGWGEHGNCGEQPETKQNDVVFSSLNKIFTSTSNEQVIGIACGCATSWVIIKK